MRFSSMATADRLAFADVIRENDISSRMDDSQFVDWFNRTLDGAIGGIDSIKGEMKTKHLSLGNEHIGLLGKLYGNVNVIVLRAAHVSRNEVTLNARDVLPFDETKSTIVPYYRDFLGRGHYELTVQVQPDGSTTSMFPAGHLFVTFLRSSCLFASGPLVFDAVEESKKSEEQRRKKAEAEQRDEKVELACQRTLSLVVGRTGFVAATCCFDCC
jgi:hypothetical protein